MSAPSDQTPGDSPAFSDLALSDAVLKPMLIGHGLEVPMPVILLGVIGGVMAYGLIGLFIGAVILAVGYVLFQEWLGKTIEPAHGSHPG